MCHAVRWSLFTCGNADELDDRSIQCAFHGHRAQGRAVLLRPMTAARERRDQ